VEVLHPRLLLRLDSFALRHGKLWLLQSEFNAVVSQCDSGVKIVLQHAIIQHAIIQHAITVDNPSCVL
jgi:hypothetical protein